ncbi:hypothetical protein [Streptomyces sp.]|uniref:hypothetical protein n=1 Tax=Streptomyces sp. TaxID=1931 RepID=UPI002F421BCA
MSTAVPKPPNGDGSVDPDNFHADGTTEAPEPLTAEGTGTVKPDNFHADGTKLSAGVTVSPDNFHADGSAEI